MDLFLARPVMHAFGAKSRIVTRDVNPTPWYEAHGLAVSDLPRDAMLFITYGLTSCRLLPQNGSHG